MKESTKNILNNLIRRERNGYYGEPIPDSVLEDMKSDIFQTAFSAKVHSWLSITFSIGTIIWFLLYLTK